MLILASNSPRRQELLKKITEDFIVIASDIEESLDPDKGLVPAIEALAFEKAFSVFKNHPEDIVIGADTIVLLGEQILGKPSNREMAMEMLKALSDNTHYVITGVSIISKQVSISFHAISEVCFYPLSRKEIESYVETYAPYDKAGAYAIQDGGALFVKEIRGDYYNIMGLPIARLNQELKRISADC